MASLWSPTLQWRFVNLRLIRKFPETWKALGEPMFFNQSIRSSTAIFAFILGGGYRKLEDNYIRYLGARMVYRWTVSPMRGRLLANSMTVFPRSSARRRAAVPTTMGPLFRLHRMWGRSDGPNR